MQTSPQAQRPPGNGAPAATTAPRAAPRMTLANVVKGKIAAPFRVALVATEGLGKSTWAAGAPSPVVIDADNGTKLVDIEGWRGENRPQSWEDVFDAIETLGRDQHRYQTLVIDTVDAIEPLCWAFICRRDGKKSIEDYGYGKGYTAALDEWRRLIAALERLIKARGMNVILLAHAQVKAFKNPLGADFDRYGMKIHEKAAGLIREWVDASLMGLYEDFAVKDESKRVRGVSSGARIVHTQRCAAWDAKNRYNLPETLPLCFEDFAAAIAGQAPVDPGALRNEIATLMLSISESGLAAKVEAAIEAAKDNTETLARIADRLRSKAQAAQAQAPSASPAQVQAPATSAPAPSPVNAATTTGA
mgnify:FL=1